MNSSPSSTSQNTPLDPEMDERMEAEVAAAMSQEPRRAMPPLFHYTSARGLLGILRERCVRATHYRHLNDKRELAAGEELFAEVVARLMAAGPHPIPPPANVNRFLLEEFLKKFETHSLTKVTDVYVASFSEHDDVLSQWRAYGGNSAGYALGIVGFSVPPNFAVAFHPCEYDAATFQTLAESRIRVVLDVFQRHGGRYEHRLNDWAGVAYAQLQRVAARTTPLFKDPAFREEGEWRFTVLPAEPSQVEFDDTARGIRPYVSVPIAPQVDGGKLSLASLVLGPLNDEATGLHAARLLLSNLGYDPSLARLSGIPLR